MHNAKPHLTVALVVLVGAGVFTGCKTSSSGVAAAAKSSAATSHPEGVKLTIEGDPVTATITATFMVASDELQAGDQVQLNYDVVAVAGETQISCGDLRNSADLTLQGKLRSGSLTKKVDPALFEQTPPPAEGTAAAAAGGLRVEGCLLKADNGEVLASAWAVPGADSPALPPPAAGRPPGQSPGAPISRADATKKK